MTKQARRVFSPEYEEQPVARLSVLGAAYSSVAAEFGVTPTPLKTWRAKHLCRWQAEPFVLLRSSDAACFAGTIAARRPESRDD